VQEYELVVVGAGAAGSAGALEAHRLGLEVVLVDEQPFDAGAYRRNVPYWFGPRAAARSERQVDLYGWIERHPRLQAVLADGIDVRLRTAVWGVFPNASEWIVGVFDGSATQLWRANAVVLATGATDLHLAFPGWTLGGVCGGLGARSLLETSGYLESRRLLVLGSNDLALEVATAARAAGVEVIGLVEVEDSVVGDRGHAARLQAAGARLWLRHTLVEARGGADVDEVRLAAVDGERVRLEASERIGVDSMCVAIGRQPSLELASLASCALDYSVAAGGWRVAHGPGGGTSQPGIYVAGDAGGTLPESEAAASGERAASAAADWLRGGQHAWRPRVHRSQNVFASRWHQLAESVASDDVLVCRCEEISRGDVLQAMGALGSEGVADPNEIKRISRAGMGVCQGRGCRPIVAGLLAAHHATSFAEIPVSSYRPPVRALPLAALATEEGADGPLLEAFGAANFTLPHARAT
jgi:thioredoxin reductase